MKSNDDFEPIFNKILGHELKKQRLQEKLSQIDAARHFNNYRQWVGNMERGKSSPTAFMLFKYAISNNLNLPLAIEECTAEYKKETRPLQMAADQRKALKYIEQTRSRKRKG